MRTGRPKKALVLTNEEREKLQQWARRPKTAQRLALRSRIVLGSAEGLSNQAVARQCGTSAPTVGKWRERFRFAPPAWRAWWMSRAPALRERLLTPRWKKW